MRAVLQEALADYERHASLFTSFLRFSPHQQAWVQDQPTPFRLKAASYVWPRDRPRECGNLQEILRDTVLFFRSRTWSVALNALLCFVVS